MSFFANLTIRFKVLSAVLGLLLLAVVGTGLFSIQKINAISEKRKLDNLVREVNATAANMDSWLIDRKLDIEAWERFQFVQDASTGNSESCRLATRELGKMTKGYRYYQTITLKTTDGVTIASSDPTRLGHKFSARGYFQDAVNGKVAISEVLISNITKKPFFTIAVPVRPEGDFGKVKAVLYAPIDIAEFFKMFTSSFHSSEGDFAILANNADRMIVAHADTSLILKKTLDSLPFGNILQKRQKNAPGCYFNIEGRPKIAVHAPIDLGDWDLWVIQDLALENAKMVEFRFMILGIALIAALVLGFILFIILQPILNALRNAARFAVTVGKGNVKERFQYSNRDEIGLLADSLNTMADHLEERAKFVSKVANQDLSVRTEVTLDEDLLGKSLDRMVESLGSIIGTVRTTASQTNESAVRLRELSAGLKKVAENTGIQVVAVADSGRLVSTSVHDIATDADHLNKSMIEAATSASNAYAISQDALKLAATAHSVVENLMIASKEIGGVVDLIKNIAGRTNLLALNATIEAAMAGAAGKGFAVVANEVKELSRATRESTDQIRIQVDRLRIDMGLSADIINKISDVILQMNTQNRAISTSIERQQKVNHEIQDRVKTAITSVEKIDCGIAQLSISSQSSSDAACETLEASQSLSTVAKDLFEQVARFKLS